MTYREFIRSGLPPAHEPLPLRRFRHRTCASCLTAAILMAASRAIDNQQPILAGVAFLVSIWAFGSLVVLFRRKVRHDLDYWTPERVRLYRAFPDVCPPDRPLAR